MIRQDTSVYLSETSFTGGQATDGGAIYIDDGSSLKMDDCSLINNKASVDGGAIYSSYSGNVEIFNSRFETNQAIDKGSHIYAAYSQLGNSLSIKDSKFTTKSIKDNAFYIKRSKTSFKRVVLEEPLDRSLEAMSQL